MHSQNHPLLQSLQQSLQPPKKGKAKTKSAKRPLDVDSPIMAKKIARLTKLQEVTPPTADSPIQSPRPESEDSNDSEPEQSTESIFDSQPTSTPLRSRASPQHSIEFDLETDSSVGHYVIDKDLIIQIERASEKHMDSLHHQTTHWFDDGWEGLRNPPANLDLAHFIRMSPPSLSNHRLGCLIGQANKNVFLSRVAMKNKSVEDIKAFLSHNQNNAKIIYEDSHQIRQFPTELQKLIQQLQIIEGNLKDSDEQIHHSLKKKASWVIFRQHVPPILIS